MFGRNIKRWFEFKMCWILSVSLHNCVRMVVVLSLISNLLATCWEWQVFSIGWSYMLWLYSTGRWPPVLWEHLHLLWSPVFGLCGIVYVFVQYVAALKDYRSNKWLETWPWTHLATWCSSAAVHASFITANKDSLLWILFILRALNLMAQHSCSLFGCWSTWHATRASEVQCG